MEEKITETWNEMKRNGKTKTGKEKEKLESGKEKY
jgi:hypothetical protein